MLQVLPDLAILRTDPWLEPYADDLIKRTERYRQVEGDLLAPGQRLVDFANAHHFFGFHRTAAGWVYREWAPAARALYLMGDFNDWNRESHPLSRQERGVWEISLPGRDALRHGQSVKVYVVGADGQGRDRLPLFIRYVVQHEEDYSFNGQIWEPESPYQWKYAPMRPDGSFAPLIYEAHVGMAQEKPTMGTYREFADRILPRIRSLGYNTVQLMAVMQHPYYASFGYQVTSFFAASSWFGTPDDLKYLIDRAHGLGLRVLMDLVHSHAANNLNEGIDRFDGSETQFFHGGDRGRHPAWDSRLFDYGKPEVLHFLLSNVKFWLEEFRFDGFRFDGVTSMIYRDHGLGIAFDHYNKYFGENTDSSALVYLQLANQLIRQVCPSAVSIAEDMSGLPGMAFPVQGGGIGFDYRLAMGMPDFWEKVVQQRDEDWDMSRMMYELSTARAGEGRIAYVESHDQALVGSKTLIFRMADQAMYWHMDRESGDPIVDRAIALHKMARLITISAGAEGYLNFMGNEFGHPEWIDFPREGNHWSFEHCRRQWNLGDSDYLRYSDLLRFDREMLRLMADKRLTGGPIRILLVDQARKLIAFEKKEHIFLFNFHPSDSYPDLSLPLPEGGCFRVCLDTDEPRFGGQARISGTTIYSVGSLPEAPGNNGLRIYIPCRTALVLEKLPT